MTVIQFQSQLPLAIKVLIGKINAHTLPMISVDGLYNKLIKTDQLSEEELSDVEYVTDRIATHYEDSIHIDKFYEIVNQ